LGKKKKALKRAQKDADREYQAGRDGMPTPITAGIRADPLVVDRFLQAYGDLTDATVELYRQLDLDDPRRQQVREALAHAKDVATLMLAQSGTMPAADPSSATVAYRVTDDYSATSASLELVRIAPDPPPPPPPKPSAIVRRVPPKRLPDEASLVRYARVRRATHRWPDEAGLARYLRHRSLPDESWLKRFVRRRRALYDRYA
jgi:hypothetical protein